MMVRLHITSDGARKKAGTLGSTASFNCRRSASWLSKAAASCTCSTCQSAVPTTRTSGSTLLLCLQWSLSSASSRKLPKGKDQLRHMASQCTWSRPWHLTRF